jgi:hypothetical protein
MASKKKRNRPRPPSAQRPAAKPSGQAGAPSKPAGAPKVAPSAKPPASKPGAGAKSAAATKQTRSERLAAAEAARRRKAARNRALIAGGIVAVLTLITVTVINTRRSNERIVEQLEASGACKYDTRTDSDAGTDRNHVTGDVRYEVDPPSGGNHSPSAASAGIFTLESKPPDPQIVHALEHGYVTIWYRPDLDTASLDELRAVTNRYNRDVLLVPRESLPGTTPVAATAWHRRLLCSQVDEAALEKFVSEYRNKGPEKVEH